ncbi:MAG TPA: HIT domain-containing protein, partial [Blastocatellia bacterium]|nr:HIT domain-containing protein [Blastocatellia bacterium]
QAKKPPGCVFCYFGAPPPSTAKFDDEHYILFRGQHNFIILNLYPYTTAHLMIVPFAHLAVLSEVAKPVTDEMMDLAKRVQHIIGQEYQPDGYNIGMNLGSAAGAGIAAHLHMHLLPRWSGDANFMTTVGETRVLPESLADTYHKLKPYFS